MSSQINTFNSIEPHHKQVIDEVTEKFEPYSDFNFVSMYSWDTDNSLRWKIVDNNLTVKFKGYEDDQHFYSIIGQHKLNECLTELLNQAEAEQLETPIRLVPESVINLLGDHADLEINEDPFNMDYVLSITEQIELRGNRFASKRYNINKFNRLYPEAEVNELELSQPRIQEEIMALFDQWADRKISTGSPKTINERIALTRVFHLLDIAKLSAVGIYIEGKLVSFVICEEVFDGYIVAHFQKGLPEFYGIFTLCLHQACILFYQKGYKWMNIEQAMGESGLAMSKELYRPIKYLKKFSINRLGTPA